MKLKTKEPYSEVIDIIENWINTNEKSDGYDDFICWIRLDGKYETNEVLIFDGNEFCFAFLKDWWEGEEVELLGFMPLSAVPFPEKYCVRE